METKIMLKMLTEKAIPPTISVHNNMEGFTLFVSETVFVQPKKTAMARTDVAIEVSHNLCAKVLPNASSACLGVYSLNNDYIVNKDSGPLNFLLVNHTNDIIRVDAGTEIAKIYIERPFTGNTWKGGEREM